MTEELHRAIEDFRSANLQWSTEDGAQSQCWEASESFVRFLKSRGIPCHLRELSFVHAEDERLSGFYMNQRNNWHYVVQISSVLIDWTARQFVTEAPYPLMILDAVDKEYPL